MLTYSADLLRETAHAAFWGAWKEFPSVTKNITFMTTSNADQETYPSLAYAPAVREMGGSRLHVDVPALTYTIVNKKWEITVPISYQLWKFGKLNAVGDLMAAAGAKHRAHFDKIVTGQMAGGHAVACIDGQFFYDTDHTDPGGLYTTNQDNDLTGTAASGVLPTDLEFATAIRAIRVAMFGFRDGAGDAVTSNVNTLDLHIPADLLSVAERVAEADTLTGPIANDCRGKFRPILNANLTTAGIMFAFNTTLQRKPFILQIAEDVGLSDNMGGDSEFNTKDVSFGTFGFYNAGLGEWRSSVRYEFT